MEKYLVGGAVRDKILNIKAVDKDWLVVGSSVDNMIKLGFKPIKKGFPVFIHPKTKETYALARVEEKISKGYYGFKFYYGKDVTLEQDLSRRDLTINAIAQDKDGKIIDPFNGLNDIKLKILRHISDAFLEDPLRVLRVARFSAKLNFKVANETMALMRKMVSSGELKELSKDLIFREISKGLMTNYPGNMLKVLYESGALKYIMPEIYFLMTKELLVKKYEELLIFKSLKKSVELGLDLTSKYICLCFNINNLQDLDNLNKRLGVGDEIKKQSSTFLFFNNKFCEIYSLSAKLILDILIKCNIFRKKDSFKDILRLSALYSKANGNIKYLKYFQKWNDIIDSLILLQFDKKNVNNIKNELYKIRIDVINKVLNQ